MTSGPEHPGYAPAPPAPTGQGAPPAMERPLVVRAGIGAFVADLILSSIEVVFYASDFDAFVEQAIPGLTDNPEITTEMLRTVSWLALAFVGLLTALQALFIWFAWRGRNWARIVLWVFGGMAVVGLTSAMGGATAQPGFITSMDVFRLLCTVAGIALLAQKPAHEWYRYRRWQRANGQR